MLTRDYIFQRKGSRNWWLRFHCPDDVDLGFTTKDGRSTRRLERSLGTSDGRLAERLAAKQVSAYLLDIQFMRSVNRRGDIPPLAHEIQWKQMPSLDFVEHDDGTWTTADEDWITRYDRSRTKIIGKERNTNSDLAIFHDYDRPESGAEIRRLQEAADAKKLPKSTLDTRIIEHWIANKAITKLVESEARRALAAFRTVAPTRTFATASKEDGRALAVHLYERGLKSQTVKKMVGHLRAAFNCACEFDTAFPSLGRNPFSAVVPMPKREDGKPASDETKRKSFDDEMMDLIRADLPNWHPEERLLWVLCATTGMRRSEAWQITGEEKVQGYRCIHIGHKTASSDRKIPIPTAALPYLPAKITGCLFTGEPKNVGRNVNRHIRRLGISDKAIVLHSTRHRASTHLNGCQDSVRDAIIGHDDNGRRAKTASRRYFGGHPVKTIAEAIEAIGL